jgi:5-methylthioadenosine/S-adenosylhomocysteine deaminase
MAFILGDAWLITMNEGRDVLESASVCVEKDRIVGVSTRQDLQRRFPEAELVDCFSPS